MADKFKGFSDLSKPDELSDKDQKFWQGGGQITVVPKKPDDPLSILITRARALAISPDNLSQYPKRGVLTIWKQNGEPVFTINDGEPQPLPLQLFADGILPAPLNARDGFEFVDKTETEYQAPVKSAASFIGSGNTLGDSSSSKATTANAQQITVDNTKPTTKLQLTFANGNRVVAVFNQDHTIEQVRSHMEALKPCGKPFELKTTYPPKTLENLTMTLKEAGLINAAVVQVTD